MLEKYQYETENASGHNWGEWTTVKSPKCIDKGSEKRICSNCHEEEYKDVDPKGHTPQDVYTVDKPASCVEEGIESKHCADCGVPLEGTERAIEMVPHTYGPWSVVKNASCEEKGQEQRECSVCHHFDTKEIAATGHDWGVSTYEWSDDNSFVTASRICNKDASHIEKETVKSITNVSKEATYTEKGQTTYTAAFQNQAFQNQEKTIENIPVLEKKENTMRVKTVKKTVKVKKLKKKAQTVAPLKVIGAQGAVSYKITGGTAKAKKSLKINAKTGKITVKKKTKKGTYKVKVTVTAVGTTEFKVGSRTVNVTVKAK